VKGEMTMAEYNKQHKENQAMQKGERRQRLHKNQNNRGDEKIKPRYDELDGNPVG